MATTSTPEQNDCEADNRDEYTPPPCALPICCEVDADGNDVTPEPEVVV